jgi:hypothetical protein
LIKQGGHESLIFYKEWFGAALKSYQEQENLVMEEIDIAIEFLMA